MVVNVRLSVEQGEPAAAARVTGSDSHMANSDHSTMLMVDNNGRAQQSSRCISCSSAGTTVKRSGRTVARLARYRRRRWRIRVRRKSATSTTVSASANPSATGHDQHIHVYCSREGCTASPGTGLHVIDCMTQGGRGVCLILQGPRRCRTRD